jgi:CubicO group peptidase (beta-lactamase class C family)
MLACALASVALFSSVGGSAQSAQPDLVAELGQRYLAEETHSAGLSIGVVRDGRVQTWHFKHSESAGPAPDDDARYEVGSIAKTMTGLLLTRAVVDGELRLDDDVRLHLDGSYANLQYQGMPVRVRHLANMTSALPDNLPDLSALDPDPGRFRHAQALAGYGKVEFLRDLRDVSPNAAPGEQVAHSNLAAQLLIYVLEHATGQSYEALLAREIERPLEFGAGSAPLLQGIDGEGRSAAPLPTAHFGWRYSLDEMLRYVSLQLDEADPAVKASHEPSWFTLDRTTGVAMPWIVTFLPEGGRRLHYSGGTWGFSSYIAVYPERKFGIVVLANNSSDTAQRRMGEIAARVASQE